MDIRRYYEILEIDPGVSPEEILQAYKDLVNVWHPDRFSRTPRLRRRAEKKLKEVNEAYEKIQSYLSELNRLNSETGNRTGPSDNTISRDTSSEKPKKTSRNLARTYPLVRCLARFIDYLLFGLFLGFMNVYGIFSGLDVPAPLFPIILTFAWVFVETALLCAFETSPGKWLLQTTIIDRSLNKPGYFGALRRSLSVWCNGMGTGIFFIVPVTMTIAYQRLRKEGYAPWDREGRFYLIHGKVSASRFSSAFLCLVVFSVLNTYQIHKQKDFVFLNTQESVNLDEEESQQGETESIGQTTTTQKHIAKSEADYADAQYRLGKVCYELGRYEEAIKALNQAVRIRPDLAEAQYGLGVSYANMHLYKKAAKALKQAIQLKPDYAEAHHILGFVYLNTGNRKASMKQQDILYGLDKDLANELLVYIGMPSRPNSIAPGKKLQDIQSPLP